MLAGRPLAGQPVGGRLQAVSSTPPANDNFANATVITSSGTQTGINQSLCTTETNEVGTSTNSFWYTFTLSSPLTTNYSLTYTDTTGTSALRINLYSLSGAPAFANLTSVGIQDGTTTVSYDKATNHSADLAAGTYYVKVGVQSGGGTPTTSGTFSWTGLPAAGSTQQGSVTAVPAVATASQAAPSVVGLPPVVVSNDFIAGATKLTSASGSLTGLSNVSFTTETGEPATNGSVRSNSMWFWFTTTGVSSSWQIDNVGTTPTYDSYLGLWKSNSNLPPSQITFTDLTNVTFNDDGGGNTLSLMTGTNLAAGTYYVNLASYSSSYNGSLGNKLNWTGLSISSGTVQGSVTALPGAATADEAAPVVTGLVLGTVTAVPGDAAASQAAPAVSGKTAVVSVPGTATADQASPVVTGLQLVNVTAVPGAATADQATPGVSGKTAVVAVPGSATAALPVPTHTAFYGTAVYGSDVYSPSTAVGGTKGNVAALPGAATADEAAPVVVGLVLANVSAVPGQATADLAPPNVVGLQLGAISAAPGQATASQAAPVVVGLQLAAVSGAPGQATADLAAPSVAAGTRVQGSVTAVPGSATADLAAPSIAAGSRVMASVNALPGSATADQAAPGVVAKQLATVTSVAGDAAASSVGAVITGRASVPAVVAQAAADASAPAVAGGSRLQGAVSAVPGQGTASLAAPAVVGLQRIPVSVSATAGSGTADVASSTVGARAQIGSVVAQASADVLAATVQARATVGASPSMAAASIAAAVISGRALLLALAGQAQADLPSPRMRPSRDIDLVAVLDARRYTAELNPRRWTSA